MLHVNKELIKSIQEKGQVVPILVRRKSEHRYGLIDGLERIKALNHLGKFTVLAHVIDEYNEHESGVHEIPLIQISKSHHDPFRATQPIKRSKTTRKDMAKHLRRILTKRNIQDVSKVTERSVAWIKRLLRENP